MITLDTWAVIGVEGDTVILENPFFPDGEPWRVPAEEIGGECNFEVGDILSTETGGWLFLEADEPQRDLTAEGQIIFADYLRRKGFHYSDPERFGYIADRKGEH